MPEAFWFDSHTWLVFLAPFAGMAVAALAMRRNPRIEGSRILRHDIAARVAHWTHALATVGLLVTGIILGLQFYASFSTGPAESAWLFNLHFVFVLAFLFGGFFWIGNTVISRYRFREHLPGRHVFSYSLRHFAYLLRIKGVPFVSSMFIRP